MKKTKSATRVGARFVNSAMMATLMGAVVSDGLEDGRVVSGVGGQYNFVEQAFALPDARAQSSPSMQRPADARPQDKLEHPLELWTRDDPRHLRDIIVTEYGVADLRGRTDKDVIAAMLSIANSRFQPELVRTAPRIPESCRAPMKFPPPIGKTRPSGSRRHWSRYVRDGGLIPPFPFGTDFTPPPTSG